MANVNSVTNVLLEYWAGIYGINLTTLLTNTKKLYIMHQVDLIQMVVSQNQVRYKFQKTMLLKMEHLLVHLQEIEVVVVKEVAILHYFVQI